MSQNPSRSSRWTAKPTTRFWSGLAVSEYDLILRPLGVFPGMTVEYGGASLRHRPTTATFPPGQVWRGTSPRSMDTPSQWRDHAHPQTRD